MKYLELQESIIVVEVPEPPVCITCVFKAFSFIAGVLGGRPGEFHMYTMHYLVLNMNKSTNRYIFALYYQFCNDNMMFSLEMFLFEACPKGKEIVQCFADPCGGKSCKDSDGADLTCV